MPNFWHKTTFLLFTTLYLQLYFFGTYFGIRRKNKKFILMKNQVTSIYKQAERFAEITKKSIISGNIVRAKKCLALAERLFISGSIETKNAISNVYIFSVSSFMEMRHCNISHLFPQTLKAEYVKQINTSGV
jgi:hypothetical protein